MSLKTSGSFALDGRVAWVIGGAGLLGSAAARALSEHGARVVLAGRSRDALEAVAEQLRGDGLDAMAATVDVADQDSVRDALDSVVASHGALDVCVNMAYRASGANFDEITAEQWQDGLSVSATGAFLVARAAARAMGRGGSIIQVASMYGVVAPDPRNYPNGVPVNPPDYGFAKAGVLQLVRYQAVQLGPRGIRVNAITPGPFPGAAARESEEFIDRLASRVPLGRVGEPQEIAGPVVFLASDASSFVTGANIAVDGGWTVW